MFTLATLKKTTAALALMGAVSTPAAAMAPVTDIEVTTESMAIADAEALAYLSTLSADLEAAIAQRVTLGESDEAVDVKIDIRNVSMNGTPVGPNATEFNQLDGVVTFTVAGTEDSVFITPVQIAAYQADGFVPEGFKVIDADNSDFYAAMVQGFAIETVNWLGTIEEGKVRAMHDDVTGLGASK